jgi:4-amino-4-deoxy-L-arabinose transferase-like glycosyltransferase
MSLEMDVTYPTRPVTGDAASARLGTLGRIRAALNVRHWPLLRQFMFALMVLYIGKQIFLAVLAPSFSGHDEVAHYSYLRMVATEHRVPELIDLEAFRAAAAAREELPGDFLPDELFQYCSYVLDWNYCTEAQWKDNPPHAVTLGDDLYPYGYQYAATHPPLYYMLMTPVYLATDDLTPEGQLYWLRVASIPFGIMTVLLAYFLVTTLFPGNIFLGITVPAFVAFQPQISYEASMFNNDIVAIALFSLILYLLVLGIRDRFPTKICVLTGAVFGLALLSKGTSMTAAPVIAFAIILGVGVKNVRRWIIAGAITGGVTLLLSWPWYLFLYRTYGNFSGLDQLEDLQYWNYQYRDKPSILDQLWNRDFAALRWNETWGEFGWRRIPLGNGILWAIGIPCLVALVGFFYYCVLIFRRRHRDSETDPVLRPTRWQLLSILLLVATVVISYFAILQFGTRFSLTQARYYFPAINAIAIILMVGLRTLTPRAADRYVAAGVIVALIAMNVAIYTVYVIPHWYMT